MGSGGNGTGGWGGSPLRVLELRSVRGTGGGPEKTILLHARRADPRRFAVTVCYIRDRRDEVFSIDGRAAALGVDYVDVWERHSFDPAIWPALRALVRERRIDLIHAHDYKTDLLALCLAQATGALALATAHGWTGHSRREQVYYAVDKRLLARFPLVIAVSSEIRSKLVRAGARPGRVRVVLNGIDHRAFFRDRAQEAGARAALDLAADEVVIGAVGRLEPQKRFDLLMHAFASLRARHPRLRLLVAGEGSARAALEAHARRLGIAGPCRLLGNRSDIPALHHAFDLFVQASDYEGTPNAVLEAMAFETPVIATAAGGTAELIEDGVHGRVVRCGDARAIEAAIEAALADRAAMARWAAAARRRVETALSFETRCATVEEIYEELAARRRRRAAAEAAR